jgi:hypothetical protein
MSNKIQSTLNYSRFKLMDGNRPIHSRVKKLIKEIKRKNMLAQYPIVCTKNGDGRLYICDGQHRFAAAQALNLPVHFIETKGVTVEDVAHNNGAQKAWTPRDFIASFAGLGNENYIALRAFIEEFGLPPSTSAAILSGAICTLSGSSGGAAHVNDGRFTVADAGFARRVAESLLAVSEHFSGFRDRGFVLAMARLMKVKAFSVTRLLGKLEYQAGKLKKCATWAQYVELIEEIYNYRARPADMVALSIEVKKQLKR